MRNSWRRAFAPNRRRSAFNADIGLRCTVGAFHALDPLRPISTRLAVPLIPLITIPTPVAIPAPVSISAIPVASVLTVGVSPVAAVTTAISAPIATIAITIELTATAVMRAA
jgi:hypothetical protein